MVEYEPKGTDLPQIEDMTKNELWELRRAFDILYMMIVRGQNLHDISRTASKLAERVKYPFDRRMLGLDVRGMNEESIEELENWALKLESELSSCRESRGELMEENERMRECLEWWLRTAEDSGWSSSVVSIKLALGMEVTDEEQGLY